MKIALVLLGLGCVVAVATVWWIVRRKNLNRWLGAYIAGSTRRGDPSPDEEVHVILCVTDHYEPKGFGASQQQSRNTVRRWVEEYPAQFGRFRDSDGRTPRHTFFYPIEEYEEDYLTALTSLCQSGFGEVEVHLHHDGDSADNLRRNLTDFVKTLSQRHGLLGRHRRTGEAVYGFIHGNWALNNCRPDGRYCGVVGELEILRSTGCYADFTFPSAPSDTQPPTVNSIYRVRCHPHHPQNHERGVLVGEGHIDDRELMLVQGPLMLDWSRRRFGVMPSVENACLQGTQPPTLDRLDLWLRARIQVPTRPDWFFVKLHGHGAEAGSIDTLLGSSMVAFHEALAQRAEQNPKFHYHYVSAREMYNLVRAAETGWSGSIEEARDYEVLAPTFVPRADSSRSDSDPDLKKTPVGGPL